MPTYYCSKTNPTAVDSKPLATGRHSWHETHAGKVELARVLAAQTHTDRRRTMSGLRRRRRLQQRPRLIGCRCCYQQHCTGNSAVGQCPSESDHVTWRHRVSLPDSTVPAIQTPLTTQTFLYKYHYYK